MAAVLYRFRVELRGHWRAWLALALLAGIAAGVVMVAFAGARRTASSLHRVVVAQRAADVLVNPNAGEISKSELRQIESRPEVAAAAFIRGFDATVIGSDGKPSISFIAAAPGTIIVGNEDGRLMRSVERSHVVSGRLAKPDAMDEIVVSEATARQHHLHAGSRFRLAFFDDEQLRASNPQGPLPPFRAVPVRVAGVVQNLSDATRAADDPRLSGLIALTPALSRSLSSLTSPFGGVFARLHDHHQVASFERATTRILAPVPIVYQELNNTLARARRTTRPYVLALWLFGILALIAGAAVVLQTAARQRRLERTDVPVLRGLGFAGRDLAVLGLLRGIVIGVGAAVISVLVAALGSTLMPIGPLRQLEPSRGLDLDLTVVLTGAFVVALVLAAQSALPELRRAAARRNRVHHLGDALARNGAPTPVVTGVRLALDPGRGEAAVPVRSTLIGVGLAVAALVATLVYASGLSYFTSTPRLYGWVWSYQIEPNGGNITDLARATRADHDVRAAAVGFYSQLTMSNQNVTAIAVPPRSGVPVAAIVTGRAPSSASEIALGRTTLRDVHKGIGDTVDIKVTNLSRRFTIVGRAVFARFAPYEGSDPTGLGVGAALTTEGLHRFGPLDTNSANSPVLASPFLLVRTRPGVTAADLRHKVLHDDTTSGIVLAAQRPNDVLSYQHLQLTPMLLAALLVLLAIATTAHLLVTGVRRRRRDFGLLRAIGFTGRQLRTSVLIQASTLVALALVVAVPTGVLAGRALWALTATWLGIPIHNVVPLATIGAVVVAALLVGNSAAMVPAIAAGHVRPADSLRTE